jgi:hypothetical protein
VQDALKWERKRLKRKTGEPCWLTRSLSYADRESGLSDSGAKLREPKHQNNKKLRFQVFNGIISLLKSQML